jgi:hypothetical protein
LASKGRMRISKKSGEEAGRSAARRMKCILLGNVTEQEAGVKEEEGLLPRRRKRRGICMAARNRVRFALRGLGGVVEPSSL